jgi:hypothetical protein
MRSVNREKGIKGIDVREYRRMDFGVCLKYCHNDENSQTNEHMSGTEVCLFNKNKACDLCDKQQAHPIMTGVAQKVVIPGIQILDQAEIEHVHERLSPGEQKLLRDRACVVTILHEMGNSAAGEDPRKEFQLIKTLQAYMHGGYYIVPRALYQRVLSPAERLYTSRAMCAQHDAIMSGRYGMEEKEKMEYLSRLSKMISITSNYSRSLFLGLQEHAGCEIQGLRHVDFPFPDTCDMIHEHVLGFFTSFSKLMKAGYFHTDLHGENMTFDAKHLHAAGDACAFRIIDWGLSIRVTRNSTDMVLPTSIGNYYHRQNQGLPWFKQIPLEWYFYEHLLDHHFHLGIDNDRLHTIDSLDEFLSRVNNSDRVKTLGTERRVSEWTRHGDESALTKDMLNAMWIAARDKFYATMAQPKIRAYWDDIVQRYGGRWQRHDDDIRIEYVGVFIQAMCNGSVGVLQRLDTWAAAKNILQLVHRVTPPDMRSSPAVQRTFQLLRYLVLEPSNSMRMLEHVARHNYQGGGGVWGYFASVFGQRAPGGRSTLLQSLEAELFTPEIRKNMGWCTYILPPEPDTTHMDTDETLEHGDGAQGRKHKPLMQSPDYEKSARKPSKRVRKTAQP